MYNSFSFPTFFRLVGLYMHFRSIRLCTYAMESSECLGEGGVIIVSFFPQLVSLHQEEEFCWS